MLSQTLDVQRGAISFVLCECVLGKYRVMLDHQPIARDLSDHTRGGDAKTEPITANKRGLRNRKRMHGQPVDQDVIRRGYERGKRAPHCLMRRPQDIEPVDFLGADDGHSETDIGAGKKFCMKTLAKPGRKFF